jgi:ABC-type cobalt transport system, permease component CbiQ and related transporters
MQGLTNLAQAGSGSGRAYQLDPRVKIVYLACLSLFSIMLDNLFSLLCLLVLALAVAFWARLDVSKYKAMFTMAALITWGTMFSQGIFYYGEPRTVLWSPTDGLAFYQEGLVYGAIQSLRFSSMTILGLVFCWTTDSAAMFRGLLGMRVPFVLAFMTVTAVRFLPVIMEETSQVMLAWRMRRGRFWTLNPWRLLLNWLGIIRPVLINCYRRSNILSLSIQARGFSSQGGLVIHARNGLGAGGRLGMVLPVALTLAVLVAKALYWFYLAGFHYSSDLRWLYELNRLYL